MRTSTPMKVKVYFPETQEGQQELARRVASVHADVVVAKVKDLPCSNEQKQGFIDRVLCQRADFLGIG